MCLVADRGLGISTYSQYDLAGVFVQLHVSVSFDDIFASERLRDLRVEISVFHALIHIALRSCESFGVFDDLPEPIPANGQRLLEGGYQRERSRLAGKPAILKDRRTGRGHVGQFVEQRPSNRIKDDSSARSVGDLTIPAGTLPRRFASWWWHAPPHPRYNVINSEETKVSDDVLSGLDRSCYFSVFAHDAIKTLFSKSSSARQLSRAIFLQHDSGFSTRLRIVLDQEEMLSAFLEEAMKDVSRSPQKPRA